MVRSIHKLCGTIWMPRIEHTLRRDDGATSHELAASAARRGTSYELLVVINTISQAFRSGRI